MSSVVVKENETLDSALRRFKRNCQKAGYIGLDRAGDTLSGGESQRIRLASQIGSGLEGVLYVLDDCNVRRYKQLDCLRYIRARFCLIRRRCAHRDSQRRQLRFTVLAGCCERRKDLLLAEESRQEPLYLRRDS